MREFYRRTALKLAIGSMEFLRCADEGAILARAEKFAAFIAEDKPQVAAVAMTEGDIADVPVG